MNKFEKTIIISEKVFKEIKANIHDSHTLQLFDVIEGEFVNYYSNNCRNNLHKFIFYFIKQFFSRPVFSLTFSENFPNYFVTYVNTSDYIFNDNILPLIGRLEKKGLKSSIVSLNRKYKFRATFPKYNFQFSLIKCLRNRIIYGSIYNIVLLLYLKIVVLPNLLELIATLNVHKNKLSKIMVSADACDLFSRALHHITRNEDKRFFLLQIGAIQNDTPEWKTVMCDSIFCWKGDEPFFESNGINYDVFFPPRFYYTLDSNLVRNTKLDIVIFLPWVHNNLHGRKLVSSINSIITDLLLTTSKNIYVKYHPAGKIHLDLTSDRITVLSGLQSNNEILNSAGCIINFGSTLSYDCNLLGIKCAIINFQNHLPLDSPLLLLENIKVVYNFDQLLRFVLDDFYLLDSKLVGDFKMVDFIYGCFSET